MAMLEQIVELGLKRRVFLRGAILTLEIKDQRHQRFCDIAPAEFAEMPALVGLGAVAVQRRAIGRRRRSIHAASIGRAPALSPHANAGAIQRKTFRSVKFLLRICNRIKKLGFLDICQLKFMQETRNSAPPPFSPFV